MSWRIKPALWDKIHHFASFPQTGVSLQQMVLFGQNPSQGTLLKASQFLAEELPVRLAHRVKELEELPHNLSHMPSIKRVRDWYAQSFEELITFPPVKLNKEIQEALSSRGEADTTFPESKPNPSLPSHMFEDYPNYVSAPPPSSSSSSNGSSSGTSTNGNGFNKLRLRVPMERRYFSRPLGDAQRRSWPPEIQDYNMRFTKTLEKIKHRHDPTVTTVAQGVLEWKKSMKERNIGLDMQAWLDRFYLSRIGIRFLIGQHIALNKPQSNPDYVGIICTQTNVHDILLEAIENARFVCEEHYAMFRGPPVQLICPPDLVFPYVPGHLSHIVFELLKNSLRAVVERYDKPGKDRDDVEYPPIKVIVVEGKEDITIKISDEGGGIPRSAIPLIFTYMYTTMHVEAGQDYKESDFRAPMAGFGYGLPLSRLYARYFGGDLRLISMDGFGTDVYIHLNRLSSSQEPLP